MLKRHIYRPDHSWSRAFGAWGQYDSNGNAATTDRSVGGFISGIDAGMGGGWRAGVTGGYMYTGLDASARTSSANVDSYVIGAYAGGPVGAFAVRTGATWMWNDIDTSRAVSFPGFFESEKASYDGDTGQIFGEVALPMARNGYALEPFAGLAYVHVGTDGFKENGSDAGLTSGGNNGDLGVGTLGARIGTTMMWGETMIVPHASLAWQYAFGDTAPFHTMAFNGTNVGFDVGGVPLAQNSALLEVGADMSIGLGATLGLSYIGQCAGHEQDNGLRGRLNWKF
ncbi:autotransporter outer membrane beta-barrel domain-containing protein [Hyphomicrobium sp.]|uniref:autotransporter outer membrane beta-barrel domain-containing protein n=1 Tax=Hyphomicrobium sp. TaxID=82 RepID=UPI0025BCC631|nr:autotransporter outer membrane beta-barrel domain-containing protein [Hyphomicrobium sp.]